jgi:hypothetical protein
MSVFEHYSLPAFDNWTDAPYFEAGAKSKAIRRPVPVNAVLAVKA